VKVYAITRWISKREPAVNGNQQARCIVATTSMKQAAALLGVSYSHFREYGNQTGNAEEIKLAESSPGAVFWQDESREWRRL